MLNPIKFQAPFKFHQFEYGDIQIKEATHINGTPYFTRRAIGEWLEYKKPQEAIDKIIKRSPHISNLEWAIEVELTTVQSTGKKKRTPQTGVYAHSYNVEIYNPIGLQLIVFESRQPRAVEYKIAVARLVNDIMTREYDRRLIRACFTPVVDTFVNN
ncbi:MAG: Bro-N domain-containing protein [Desulfobacteraceae bacterium]|nr:Bro-N domain-containing protein [Desulfobacteraceae bacterium]